MCKASISTLLDCVSKVIAMEWASVSCCSLSITSVCKMRHMPVFTTVASCKFQVSI